jgi:hypothetical protein
MMLPAQPAAFPIRSLTAAERGLLYLSCALLFVWSIPWVMALRLALIVILLIMLVWQGRRFGAHVGGVFHAHRRLWTIYLLLSAWIVIEALLFSVQTRTVLGEIWGQWIRSGITGLIGFLLAAIMTRQESHRTGPLLAVAMAATLAFQVGLHDLDTLWRWWHEGSLPFQQTRIVQNRTGISFLTNLLMAMLCAEAMARILFGRRYLPLSWPAMGAFFVLCGFATYVVGTRYGTLGFLTLMASCAIVGLFAKRKAVNLPLLLGGGFVLFAVLAAFGWASMKSDPRWLTLQATIPVALDTEHQQAWRNAALPMPALANGSPAEESAYLRLAWAKEAVTAIGRAPLGVGYGRNSFGHAMQMIYPDYASSLNCHSGILNFTVGVGWPGLVLWLGIIGLLAVNGWRSFFRFQNPAGLLLLFVVSGFFTRSVVDGNFQDHMFEQFMFLAMMFSVLAAQDRRSGTAASDAGGN